jgi:hypothetical protein
MNDVPISYPGRYAPGVAVNFADATGSARQVSESSPLPVTLAAVTAAQPAALAGVAAAAVTVGPYAPSAGKPLILSLSGSWTGTVSLLRSVNGGATRLPLSLAGAPWGVFSGNACEPVWDETESAATFYLQLAPTSGAVTYRLAQ